MENGKKANKILEGYRRQSEIELKKREDYVRANIPEYYRVKTKLDKSGTELLRINIQHSEDEEKINNQLEKIKFYEKRMEEILIENGLEKDFLKKKFRCTICEDQGVYNGKICKCKEQIITNLTYETSELNEKIVEENFENFDFNLFSDEEIPGKNISHREIIKFAYDEMLDYANNFNGKDDDFIIFTGDVGVGKTYLCSCVAKRVMDKGFTVMYQSAPSMMKFLWDYYYSSFNLRKEETERFELIRNADLLIIDDLGTENMSEKSLSHFFQLLNERISRKKPLLISTNMGISDIRSHYDERVYSRIVGEFEVFTIVGDDLRLKKKGY